MLFVITFIIESKAQVGIGTTTPSSNAALEINSQFSSGNYGGFMPPKITIAQRDAIAVTAADDGLMAYVSGFPNGERCLQLFNGASMTWESINCFAVPESVVLFFETMGNVSSNTNISTHQTNLGFDNSATCTFSSTTSSQSQIRITIPVSSANIATASGGGYVYFATGNRNFLIQGINVTSQTGPLTLQMLIYKASTTSAGSELTIEYSVDGSNWVNVSTSSLPTGTGTDIWHQVDLTTNLPNTIQQLRISRGSSGPEFRVDDIKIFKP